MTPKKRSIEATDPPPNPCPNGVDEEMVKIDNIIAAIPIKASWRECEIRWELGTRPNDPQGLLREGNAYQISGEMLVSAVDNKTPIRLEDNIDPITDREIVQPV